MAVVAIGCGVGALASGAGAVVCGITAVWYGEGLVTPASYANYIKNDPYVEGLKRFLTENPRYARCALVIGLVGTIVSTFLFGSVAWTLGAVALGYGTNASVGLIALKAAGAVVGLLMTFGSFMTLKISAFRAGYFNNNSQAAAS